MTISTSIELYDNFSGVISSMTSAMNSMLTGINNVQGAMNSGIDMSSFDTSRDRINEAEAAVISFQEQIRKLNGDTSGVSATAQALESTENHIRNSTNAQGQFNNELAEGANKASSLLHKIKSFAAAYIGIKSAGEITELSDEITSTNARLELMIDNFGEASSGDELFKRIYTSAQDARGSITDTAAVVARFGNNAKDAFGSTEEVVEFANLVQKQMTIAGATTAEASNAMLQLSQALGSGTLRGDELNSIFEQAPNLIQNIADYLNKPIGKIREMASEGEITADIVKNAIFAATDDINERFENMPMTFSQIWTAFENAAIMAFKPVLQNLNDIANSKAVQSFVNNTIFAVSMLANTAVNAMKLLGSVSSVIASNWSWIVPLVWGAVAAFTVYNATMGIAWLSTLRAAAAMAWKTVCDWAETAAIFAMIAAQNGLNAALAACPITWIIIMIIALIAIIFAVCAAVAHFTKAANSALGVICGAVAVACTLIWNSAAAVINGIIQFIWTGFVTPFLSIIEWVLNTCNGGFNSFGDAVKNLIGQIISWFLSLGEVVTKIIDAIFGTDWTAGLNSLQSSVLKWGKNENAITLDRTAPEVLQRAEYGTAWSKGTAFGDSISTKISSGLDNIKNTITPAVQYGENALNGNYANAKLDNLTDSSDDTAENTKKIVENTKNSDDILSMIKDSISKERIASYTTKQINVDMSGMSNKIASSLSINDVVKEFEKKIAEAAAATAEGV